PAVSVWIKSLNRRSSLRTIQTGTSFRQCGMTESMRSMLTLISRGPVRELWKEQSFWLIFFIRKFSSGKVRTKHSRESDSRKPARKVTQSRILPNYRREHQQSYNFSSLRGAWREELLELPDQLYLWANRGKTKLLVRRIATRLTRGRR